eukprot:scaffold450962_cov16-Prasinocladus_malaysianus.AAC.1
MTATPTLMCAKISAGFIHLLCSSESDKQRIASPAPALSGSEDVMRTFFPNSTVRFIHMSGQNGANAMLDSVHESLAMRKTLWKPLTLWKPAMLLQLKWQFQRS